MTWALIHFSRQSAWRINVMTTLNWITTHSQALSGCTPGCLGRAPAEAGDNNAPAVLSGGYLPPPVCMRTMVPTQKDVPDPESGDFRPAHHEMQIPSRFK